jgi:hypothetical protein
LNGRRRPVRGAAGNPIFCCFLVVIDRDGLARESGPIVEAIDIDDGPDAGPGIANGADIHATIAQIRYSAVRELNR